MALGRKSRRGVEFFPGFSDIVEIGMGSLSTVYQAREAGTNRRVALKLLNVKDAEPRAVESFEREAVALAELGSHPNIVTLYRMFTAPDGRPVLVLELCRGSMGERMINATAVPVPEAVAIGIKIAGALETAHRAQILHRDVKPQNILVTEFGEPALADFGVAMLQSSTQTTAGLFDFTTLHAAPELLEGGSTSAATDVYELASTLYQMIAGQSAFRAYDGESPASVILRILRDPVRPLVAQDVPPPLSDLLIWAMSKDRESRPPTAAEFATALAEVEIAQGWPRTQFLIRDGHGSGSAPSITRMPDQVPRADRGRLQPPVALPPPVAAYGSPAGPLAAPLAAAGPASNGASPPPLDGNAPMSGAPAAPPSDPFGPVSYSRHEAGVVDTGPSAEPSSTVAATPEPAPPVEVGLPTLSPDAASLDGAGGTHRRDTHDHDAGPEDDEPAAPPSAPATHVRPAATPGRSPTGRHGDPTPEPPAATAAEEPSVPTVPESGLIDSVPDFLPPAPRIAPAPRPAPEAAPPRRPEPIVAADLSPAAAVEAEPASTPQADRERPVPPVLPSAPPDLPPVVLGPPLDATLPPGSLPAEPQPDPASTRDQDKERASDDFSAPRTFGREDRGAPVSPPVSAPAPWRPPTPAPGDLLRPPNGPRPGETAPSVPATFAPAAAASPVPSVPALPPVGEPVPPSRPEEPPTTVRKLPPLPVTETPAELERTHRRSELPLPPTTAAPAPAASPMVPPVPVHDPYATTFRSDLSHQVPGGFVRPGEPPLLVPSEPTVLPGAVPPGPHPPRESAPPAPSTAPPSDRMGGPSWWADVNAPAPEHTYTGPRPPLPQNGARPQPPGRSEPERQERPAGPAPGQPSGPPGPPGPPPESAPARPETAAVPMWALRQAAAQINAGGQFADLGIDPYSLQSKLTVRSGLASVTIDDNGIRARRGLSRVNVAWIDIHGFEPRGQAESAVLGAVTGTGWVELAGTKRPMAELQHVHALFDAYRARALGTGR